jgi:type VI secretion system protein ImpG
MDPRLLRYYNQELNHVREMGSEFAREFPKIAGRLGMEGIDCADPYVERLLEGFAFMAARVQLKVDAEFPQFTQHLFELIYPHYLAPTPSMAVVNLEPDLNDGGLAEGFSIPRGSAMQSKLGKGDQTTCTYTTAQDLTLWPLELTEARYFSGSSALANIGLEDLGGARAGIRFRFRATAGLAFDELPLDRLPLYICGADELPNRIYEQLLGNSVGAIIRPKGGKDPWQVRLPASSVRPMGFGEDQALLPYTRRSFQGYRLLQEYFAFPDRYLFVELCDLQRGVSQCAGTELEIVVLLDRSVPDLESTVDAERFALNCVPIINLFEKRADRIHIDRGQPTYHVLPDRTRPLDFEVYSVEAVRGYGSDADDEVEFMPFYASRDTGLHHERMAYFTAHREPRTLSSRQRKVGARASYVGSEVYLTLVDAKQAPFSGDLRQVGIKTTCTNRDLPLQILLGKGKTDFTLESGAPVESIRCVSGPTRPRASLANGDASWNLISHLSLNYMSLVDSTEDGAVALRELLSLYADENDAATRRQIEGVKSVSSKPITRRLPTSGPISFGRGLEVTVECEDGAFEGIGAYLLGSVLESFFARYVSTNSFTETVLKTDDRGEIARWPARIGRRPRL